MMIKINLIVVLYIIAIYLSETTSDLLDLQSKILKDSYTGQAHTYFEKVTKNSYLDDIKSVGTSGPPLNRLPSLPLYERSVNDDTTDIPHFTKIVKQFGYEAEEHTVTTPDGYILRLHRISGSPKKPKAPGKPVMFFQHGLLVSTDWWAVLGPSKDLAYESVDAGYDVWLGNVRGNTYSRSHVTLSPDYDPQFWQYSFHEMALFDVTAEIDYILETTGQKNLIYVGHSMGTTISYVLLSQRPEYNDKIRLVISMAPVAFWHGEPRPLVALLKDGGPTLQNYFDSENLYELLPLVKTDNAAGIVCSTSEFINSYCLKLFSFVFDPERLDEDAASYAIKYVPTGTSKQTLIHYYQNIAAGHFQAYDLGKAENLRKYGQEEPPHYELNNIATPVALYYGNGDALVSPENVKLLSEKLQKVAALEMVGDEKFNHVEFLFAPKINEVLNIPILKLIKNTLGDDIDV